MFAAADYESGDKLCRIAYENANSYRRIMKKIAHSLPLRQVVKERIGTHTARHTFGTYLASRISLVVLQELMAHTDIKETMIYVHLTEKRKEEA